MASGEPRSALALLYCRLPDDAHARRGRRERGGEEGGGFGGWQEAEKVGFLDDAKSSGRQKDRAGSVLGSLRRPLRPYRLPFTRGHLARVAGGQPAQPGSQPGGPFSLFPAGSTKSASLSAPLSSTSHYGPFGERTDEGTKAARESCHSHPQVTHARPGLAWRKEDGESEGDQTKEGA